MTNVVLNKAEATWFSRNVIKTKTMMEAHAKRDAKILERKTYLTMKALAPQAEEMTSILEQLGDEPFELSLLLKDKQKRIVRDMVDLTIASLETRIIPEYERRGEKFTEYLADAKAKVELLKEMRRKFK